ncbi:hypothetical protein QO021_28930 (plasmid) [Pseudomonas amygdali pv. lachrymans]|nr:MULTISPECIES: hypothetical protein [Pseudomonas syringae group]RMM39496.1 hypothetical protein ALQ79_200516 [Pseudomonas amygdali pv. lachrymans]UBZ00300.1 hypothetical protein LCG56_28440 [Pseudomonas cannabina pv. alisalensis]WIO61584.1 hypothetical protein QO021_28930 [Pseudomonas amygdali pv. lachrymans]
MNDQRRIQLLLRSPKAMMDFACSGRLPQESTPTGPLINLIESVPPRLRSRITNVIIGPDLGYQGSHRFQSLAQALNWLKPSYPSVSYPSESWRLKRFTKQLLIDDLAPFCKIPDSLLPELRKCR